ncbi:MAG TPA: MFS transporter [Vicinamibacterales bacterium]|nr:MFS transporter [Vicinamibacterales bacterium]
MQRTVLDVRRFLDQQPVSRFQLRVAALCAALVFMDGFDAQVMGFVAPALSGDLHIPRVALGTVISSGVFGMMIGALSFGPLADRWGRKPVLVACAATFAVGALLTAGAASVQQLTACRVFTGLGLGGAMPNAIALTSEYMPARSRNAAVMTMFCGFSLGSACAGWVAAACIGRFGWRSVFLIGGSIPILLALLAIAVLPESIRFLVLKGGQQTRIAGYLSRIAPGAARPDEVVAGEDAPRSGSPAIGQLFAGGRAGVTLLLWTMFFMNLLNLWFLNNWLPTIMHDAGMSIETASLITSLFQLGGLIGSLTLAGLWGRNLAFGPLAAIYASAALCILLVGEAGASIPLLVPGVFAAGISVIGGQTASNALAADFYPTAIRATGVGWALGIGRVGSMLGPILGGILLSYGDTRRVFWAAAVPAVIAACAALGARQLASGTRA